MNYLIERAGKFYFNRRIPEPYRKYDNRGAIRFSLKTTDYKTACRRALAENDRLEAYWRTLIHSGQAAAEKEYLALTERAKTLGFSYYPTQALTAFDIEVILKRLFHIEDQKYNEKHAEAVLGKAPPPVLKLDQVIDRYFELARDAVLNKSPNQVRKWENPRKKAMANFIKCIGNKAVNELTREDTLKFRDWWIERIKNEKLVIASANKDLIHVKTMVTALADNLKIEIDTAHLFKKLIIVGDDSEKRLPFETSFIVNTLLNPQNLKGLNEQARWALYAFAETGAGLNELTGLLPEDIVLNADIPYIHIRARKGRSLKTKFRNRVIPLVGFALDAFKACPRGFEQYRDRPDSLSTLMSKYLRDNDLLPTQQHTIYSLRHSFQDRLLAVNTPDRIQADLMGHKFNRPQYGEGATLMHKREWMEKVALKNF